MSYISLRELEDALPVDEGSVYFQIKDGKLRLRWYYLVGPTEFGYQAEVPILLIESSKFDLVRHEINKCKVAMQQHVENITNGG